MEFLEHPAHAGICAPMPISEDGLCRIFYVKQWRGYYGEDRVDGWHMLTTRDHRHFEEQPVGIQGGPGCVVKADGTYHAFYSLGEASGRQRIGHAVSKNLREWMDGENDLLEADGQIYDPADWREPFVWWHPQEKRWWMLVATKTKGQGIRRGCVGLCVSEDLYTWEYCAPLYAPHLQDGALENPGLFQMGDWYYLTFAARNARFQTAYRMAQTPAGPWLAPLEDAFDTRAFVWGKAVGNEQARFLYGFCPTKELNLWQFNPRNRQGYDYNTWDQSGALVVHRLAQQADGTLRACPLEKPDKLAAPSVMRWHALNGNWEMAADRATGNWEAGYADALSQNEVPDTGRLEMNLSFGAGTKAFGVAFQVNEEFTRGYYLCFEPERNRVQWKSAMRMYNQGGSFQGGWVFHYDVELERPLRLTPEALLHLVVEWKGGVMVAYVEGQAALTARMYDYHNRRFGLFVEGGHAAFSAMKLWTEQ